VTYDEEIQRLLILRYELITAYREMYEDMDMVISRVPAVAEDPRYIAERKKMDETALKALDEGEAVLRALGWEG
jgi:hypothetical protein